MWRQHGGEPLVFGKPWFWQRSSGAADGSRGLARVLMEMRDEIAKLEAENRQLRADSRQPSSGHEDPEEAEQQPGDNPNLRRNASAPVLKGRNQETSVMTVRRYSANCSLAGLSERERGPDGARRSTGGWGGPQEEARQRDPNHSTCIPGEEGPVGSRRSLQGYVHKNRAKVKTVTFLLPVDDIYTNRPVLSKRQDGPRAPELAPISETES